MKIRNTHRLRALLIVIAVGFLPLMIYYSFQLGLAASHIIFEPGYEFNFNEHENRFWAIASLITGLIALVGYVYWEWIGNANKSELQAKPNMPIDCEIREYKGVKFYMKPE